MNGHELRDIDKNKRQKLLALQGHDSFLFSGTIIENITFEADDNSVDKKRLEKAISIAALKEDLASFKDGINTIVGVKGATLSGGQRQRISLARCLYSQSEILLLDDPFSAVDVRSEKRMSEGLEGVNDGKVMIIMTHRLDTLKGEDNIIVLSSGKIVEQGDQETLMAKKGTYADILQAQSTLGCARA